MMSANTSPIKTSKSFNELESTEDFENQVIPVD